MQIKDRIELCFDARSRCDDCAIPPCLEKQLKNALALINSQEQKIKELTEEKDELYRLVDDKIQECEKWKSRLKIECEYTKADTVRKMQEALEQRIHSKLSYHGWYLKETVIAEIAKEMLEGGDGIQDN